MRTLRSLQLEATRAMKWRGHWPYRPWVTFGRPLGPLGACRACNSCEALVTVRTQPRANEIDIGGDAVAVNCRLRGR